MAANPDPQLDASGVDVADFNTNGLKTTTQSDTIKLSKSFGNAPLGDHDGNCRSWQS